MLKCDFSKVALHNDEIQPKDEILIELKSNFKVEIKTKNALHLNILRLKIFLDEFSNS